MEGSVARICHRLGYQIIPLTSVDAPANNSAGALLRGLGLPSACSLALSLSLQLVFLRRVSRCRDPIYLSVAGVLAAISQRRRRQSCCTAARRRENAGPFTEISTRGRASFLSTAREPPLRRGFSSRCF